MKNIVNKLIIVTAFGVLLSSCKPELAIPTASIGKLNLSSYVAIGNSLTAGYASNGLCYEGQNSSYANALAEQFKLVKPDLVFKTPFIDPSSVGCGAPAITTIPTLNLTNPFALLLTPNITINIKGTAPFSLQSLPNCKGVTSLSPAVSASSGDLSVILDPNSPNFDASTNSYSVSFAGSAILTGFPDIKTAPSIYYSANYPGPYNNMGVPGARCVDVALP